MAKGAGSDSRVAQARVLFNLGWGKELGHRKFHNYLATIPMIPEHLLAQNFPLLVLVDPRLGYSKSCRLAKLAYVERGFDDNAIVVREERYAVPRRPYWVRAHDGSPNLNRKPGDCRAACTGRLFPGTLDVGIAIRIIHGVRGNAMDLPGSGRRGVPDSCVYIDAGVSTRSDHVGFEGHGTVVFMM